MKKLSVLFATLMIVAMSVTSCKKAEVTPVKSSNDSVIIDSSNVDSIKVDSAIVINK